MPVLTRVMTGDPLSSVAGVWLAVAAGKVATVPVTETMPRATGALAIVIRLGEQSLTLYKAGNVVLKTAVTTDSNTIFASDYDRLLALPRLSYNGRFQDTPLLDLLLSGALPRLRRGLRPTSVGAA